MIKNRTKEKTIPGICPLACFPRVPGSDAQESDCSPSALKRFHRCLLPMSALSSQSSNTRAPCLRPPGSRSWPLAATETCPAGASPCTLWFEQPLWPLDGLVGSTAEAPGAADGRRRAAPRAEPERGSHQLRRHHGSCQHFHCKSHSLTSLPLKTHSLH